MSSVRQTCIARKILIETWPCGSKEQMLAYAHHCGKLGALAIPNASTVDPPKCCHELACWIGSARGLTVEADGAAAAVRVAERVGEAGAGSRSAASASHRGVQHSTPHRPHLQRFQTYACLWMALRQIPTIQ